jgi:trimeric autotransporter adhesin
VIVVPKPVATVRLSPSSKDLVVGESAQLTAEPLDATGAVLSGRPVTWTTSRPTVATVNANGGVSAIAAGSAVITATIEGKSGVAAVTVSPAPVSSVVVSPSSAALVVGQALAFEAEPRSASGQPLDGRAVAWSSSAPQVASVAQTGVVIALSPGTATITASSEGRTGSAQLTVLAPTVHRVEVTPASAVIDENASFRLTATVYDSRGNVLVGQDVTWTSSDTRIATVDATGRVRGEREGTVTITATSGGASGTAQVRVRED